MEEIQKTAMERFSNNLVFLQGYDNELYERIMVLSTLIDNEEYTPRYHLDYIQQEKEFDIYDSVTDSYIYDKKPVEFIKEALKSTDFDKNNTIDLLKSDYFNSKQPFDRNSLKFLRQIEGGLVVNDIFEYTKVFNASTTYKYKRFKHIEKFVFVGTLLGSHILPIHKKINAPLYFICEHNLEIFRLSLFVTPYYKLTGKSNILFSVMDDDEQFNIKFRNYFDAYVNSNYMIKYYCSNYNVHNYFDKMLAVSSERSPLSYSYRKILEGYLKPALKNIGDFRLFKTGSEHHLLNNTPVLIIAAGPSFGKNITWIKDNQHKFTIIAIGAAVEKLISAEILPDIIISVEADELALNQFPKEIHNKVRKIPFIGALFTNKQLLEIFDKENVSLIELMGRLKKTSKHLRGFTVGEIALDMSAVLGSNEIYLLGTDLALDQESGATHIDSHQNNTNYEINDKMEYNSFLKEETVDLKDSTIIYKGNFRENVVTTLRFFNSIEPYCIIIDEILRKAPSTKIYNLSDGVFLKGTTPKKIEDIKIPDLNKKPLKEEISQYLKQNSTLGLQESEIGILQGAIVFIDQVIEKLKEIENQMTEKYDMFLKEREPIIALIRNCPLEYRLIYLDKLYIHYTLTMEPYLGYQFNEKMDNEANIVKKVKKIWCGQMIELSNEYKKVLIDTIGESR